jgi:hypothetical protein
MQTTSRSVTPGLDRALDSALDERRIVGGYLVVSREGEPVYERAAGHRLLETIRLDAADGQQGLLRQESAQSLLQGQIGDIETEPGKTLSFMGSVMKDSALAGTPQSAGTVGWGGVYGQLSLDVRDAIYDGIE